VRPCESTRILPRPLFASPTVAGRPFAVFGGAVAAVASLLPPPQLASARAMRGITAAVARKVMDLLRVMLVPLVGGIARIWAPRGMRAPAL
jgi:hypothetical protein